MKTFRTTLAVCGCVLGAVSAASGQVGVPVRGVNYSNNIDEAAVIAGGEHINAAAPRQVLRTAPPDPAGAPSPSNGIILCGTSDVDALANEYDLIGLNVQGNAADLLVSFLADPGANAAHYEVPSGSVGVKWTQVDFHNPNPGPAGGTLDDVDALGLRCPNFFSEVGDPPVVAGGAKISVVFAPVPFVCIPFITHAQIVAAVTALGYIGPAGAVDLDALMVGDFDGNGLWTGPDIVICSIRDTRPAGNFDGGEIIVLRPVAAPVFLAHGGHTWNTAFAVAATFGVGTEEVDALEATPATIVRNAIVLVDRSGSMVAPRSTGNTRCADALIVAARDIRDFFRRNTLGSLAVWSFAGTAVANETGGFVGETAALAAVSALSPTGCAGNTPLADALCQASNTLVAAFPGSPAADRPIYVISDGGENSSSGPCAGPNSIAGPPPPGNYTAGSWQDNAYTTIVGQTTLMARFWGGLGRAADEEPGGQPRGPGVPDTTFFQDLTSSTGGAYLFIDDADAGFPPVPEGACCLPELSCAVVSPFMCESFGGAYQGDGVSCGLAACPLFCADIDGDGDEDAADLQLFVMVLLDIDTGNPVHIAHSDMNMDCQADGLDVSTFLGAFLTITPCPPQPPPPCECDGDFNGDGIVSAADIIFFVMCLANPGEPGCQQADLNCDGLIDDADQTILVCLINCGFDPACMAACCGQ